MTDRPIVSVVIPTCNRPKSLARLLRCVAEQDLAALECIVVDDGSNQETLDSYGEIWRGLDNRFRLHLKSPTERASGPSATRNRGIALAKGKYIAFCDDDDHWIKADHLSVAAEVMSAHEADLFFANMRDRAGDVVRGTHYHGSARTALERRLLSQTQSVFHVSTHDMAYALQRRTLHSNTIVVEKTLLVQAGLYWEKTNIAEDLDMGFRLADRARKILFRCEIVAERDISPHDSIIKGSEPHAGIPLILSSILHAEITLRKAPMRRAAKRLRAWYLHELAYIMASESRYNIARELSINLC